MSEATLTSRAAPMADVHQRESIKDTIESIVVALILAFVFRAFVVEAFVIPTGSMAPTLYGAHGTIVCEDCGTEFAYGLRDLSDHRNIVPVGPSATALCPNCNHRNSNLKTNDLRRNPESGDRILVFKWPYDVGSAQLAPARWDVVVFKDPADGETNFIKRLVGLPGDILMIVDGDVYTVPIDQLSEQAVTDLDRVRHQKYELRTGRQRGRLRPIRQSTRLELAHKMTVARKTPAAQEALWFPVYNHDYRPQRVDPGQPFWYAARREQSGWDARGRRVRFEDCGVASDFIELAGKPIAARCAYNIRSTMPPVVSDVRVRFVLTPAGNTGTVRIRLQKHKRVFWATIQMNGRVSITESEYVPSAATPAMLTERVAPLASGKSVEVGFQILDYRVSLSIRGKEILATSTNPTSKVYFGPDVFKLQSADKPSSTSPPPRIYGEGGNLELRHLVVDRDLHYYVNPGIPALSLSWAPRSGWASAESPIMLREGEYFMLGDNTAASKDGRLWDTWGRHLAARGEAFQLGTVPEDQLIGKAFFVYWPSPNRLSWLEWLPVLQGAVVPDVGRMRWIR